jgi:O-antigen/teichoic acid export membrane protein
MADVLANASLGMSIQLGLAIALAAVGTLGRAGLVTDYSYGYFIVIALTGFTSAALNTVILPDVVAEVSRRGLSGARDRIVAVAPFSFGVVVPIIAGLLAFGEPLLEWAAGPLLSPADIQTVFGISTIFTLAAFGQIFLHNGSTAVISMGRWRLIWTVALASLLVQAVAVWAVRTEGANAIAWAHAIATTLTALALISALFREQALRVLIDSLKPLLRLVPCAAGFLLFRLLVGGEPSSAVAIAATTLSAVIYVALAMVFVPTLRNALYSLVPGREAAI